ncbi:MULTISPECIES: primosomal protein N' [Gammaproteobacteria]|uniref:primosomal protein N' n=1 Tax=Gammaproteobacteria TaxID=1236 RepID=UPI000DD0A236|nr:MULTISPECIES: primosomal protein N' [Gammaproteobacteria]RTE85910.1 primosomal protein N' [Aliidiomarina sp. B3213]TCZ90329.1 primosomal protein N' [Lysobacter sp. N42]
MTAPPANNRFVSVALPVPLRQVFDYLLPANLPEPPVGGRVFVPFGRRKLIGFVLAVGSETSFPVEQIKQVEEVIDSEPLWPKSMWDMLQWAAHYYHHPLGDVLQHAAPALVRQGKMPKYETTTLYALTEEGSEVILNDLGRAPQQQKLLAALQKGPVSAAGVRAIEVPAATVKTLIDKNWIEATTRSETPQEWECKGANDPLRLNAEQAVVVAAMASAIEKHEPKVWLLEGVTGSGKTEVYLQAMEPVLKRGEQVLVLVPEIGLTPQTIKRFAKRFDVPIVVLHSQLTDTERLQSWLQAKDGKAAIIIGTRSAIFTPCKNIGLMIIDEEHDASFKQQDGFRYNARDLAVKRAHQEKFSLILGSATPSLESLANVKAERYSLHQLTQRAGSAQAAQHEIIDLKQQRMSQGLAEQTMTLMARHLQAGNQVLLFINRRGYASSLLCHECGWVSDCNRCESNMTLHQQSHSLQCHHCGSQRRVPRQCGQCGSTQLISQGLGTEQLEEALQKHFPGYPVLRIDRDSTRKKGQLETALQAATKGEYPILLGTQMLAKGHHFPDVTLVALLDVDGALYSSDFRAPERLAQLFVQVAGRAGRAEKKGTVLLQTHHPEHPLVQELVNNGYRDFAQAALEEREIALLPPYSAMALLRSEATSIQAAESLLKAMLPVFEAYGEVTAMGPISAPLGRRAGRYRFQLILYAQQRAPLHKCLREVLPILEKLPETRKARWSLDIDPQDFA